MTGFGNQDVSRRTVMAGALGTAALIAAGPAFAHTPGKKPNFLFIMADDLGYADLSVYGRRDYETPVLDRLAAQGMRFTHAYANSPVCSPTRVGLITGRYQYRLPVGLVEPIGAGEAEGLPPSHPTMPSLLRDLGYRTSLIGKWHLGSLPNYGPLKSGYDEFWGIRHGGVDYFTHKIYGEEDLWDGDTLIEENGYLTELLAERTLETLEKRSREDQPWLISLHLTAPHWPWEGPDDRDVAPRLDTPEGVGILHYDGGNLATYAEMVTYMDAQIGRILEKLTELGMDQDTVVVFTSDNGGERFSDNWPFTGMKTELLEGGIRIPAIVRWPGLSMPGAVSETPIMSMDWMPTFLAAAGGAPHPQFPSDGIDLREAIAGRTIATERPLFWKYRNHDQQAARIGRWKYLQIAGNTFLFDVVADPLERGNLKEREPERFAQLVEAWQRWNTGMLAHPDGTSSAGFTGDVMADHIGIGTYPRRSDLNP